MRILISDLLESVVLDFGLGVMKFSSVRLSGEVSRVRFLGLVVLDLDMELNFVSYYKQMYL